MRFKTVSDELGNKVKAVAEKGLGRQYPLRGSARCPCGLGQPNVPVNPPLGLALVSLGSLMGQRGLLCDGRMCQSITRKVKINFNLDWSFKNFPEFSYLKNFLFYFIDLFDFVLSPALYFKFGKTGILYMYTNIMDILQYSQIWD